MATGIPTQRAVFLLGRPRVRYAGLLLRFLLPRSQVQVPPSGGIRQGALFPNQPLKLKCPTVSPVPQSAQPCSSFLRGQGPQG